MVDATPTPTKKLWDGRFTEATDAFVEAFTASVGFDQKMALQDIRGSVAHATMLQSVGILTDNELGLILSGLSEIRQDIVDGNFQWSVSLEDVHMNIEAA
ncbi:MAG: argininosuccinate lyase, partial [Candidatus Azotimanducaceae bacterium]